MALPHIRMAKHMLKSFLLSVEDLDLDCLSPMISYAVEHMGIEFDSQEAQRDYYLGGWIPKRTHFLSDVLFDLVDPEKDPRYLRRIFNFVTQVEALNRPHAKAVPDPEKNHSLLGQAMGLFGKPSSNLFHVCHTLEDRNKFYKRLIDFEKKPLGYVSLVEGFWKKHKRLDYETSLEDLYKEISSKVDCNIPPELVYEYADKGEIVNTSWIGFNELDLPNRTIKEVVHKVCDGSLKSNLPYPTDQCMDCWKYCSQEYKCGLPKYAVDYPFVPIHLGDIQNICSDGLHSLGNHAIDYGLIPKRLCFDPGIREKLPPWRKDPELLRKPVRSIEEIELEIRKEEILLPTFIGTQIIERIQFEKPESVEVDDLENVPERELEPETDNWSSLAIPKLKFSIQYWDVLFKCPECKDNFVDIRCEAHKDNNANPAMIPAEDCLPCKIWVWNTRSLDNYPREVAGYFKHLCSAEELLMKIGLEFPEEVDFDEGGGLFGDDDEDDY